MRAKRRERVEHGRVVSLLPGERAAHEVGRVEVADRHGVAPRERMARDHVRGPRAHPRQRLNLLRGELRRHVAQSLERGPALRQQTAEQLQDRLLVAFGGRAEGGIDHGHRLGDRITRTTSFIGTPT